MDRIITATEANQRFSEMLRDVAAGESFTVTSHGRPVARVQPVEPPLNEAPSAEERARRRKSMERFLAGIGGQPIHYSGSWTREDLYER